MLDSLYSCYSNRQSVLLPDTSLWRGCPEILRPQRPVCKSCSQRHIKRPRVGHSGIRLWLLVQSSAFVIVFGAALEARTSLSRPFCCEVCALLSDLFLRDALPGCSCLGDRCPLAIHQLAGWEAVGRSAGCTPHDLLGQPLREVGTVLIGDKE